MHPNGETRETMMVKALVAEEACCDDSETNRVRFDEAMMVEIVSN